MAHRLNCSKQNILRKRETKRNGLHPGDYIPNDRAIIWQLYSGNTSLGETLLGAVKTVVILVNIKDNPGNEFQGQELGNLILKKGSKIPLTSIKGCSARK